MITSVIGTIPIWVHFVIGNLFKQITPAIDSLLHFSVRNYLIKFVNNSYDVKTSSIVNLLIFNIKQDVAKEVYQTMIDMSVVYLIVIGGMHLSFVQNTLLPVKIFNNIFAFFYTYLLNFSISTSRVILSNACGLLKCR